jgi:hypothetical protein
LIIWQNQRFKILRNQSLKVFKSLNFFFCKNNLVNFQSIFLATCLQFKQNFQSQTLPNLGHNPLDTPLVFSVINFFPFYENPECLITGFASIIYYLHVITRKLENSVFIAAKCLFLKTEGGFVLREKRLTWDLTLTFR